MPSRACNGAPGFVKADKDNWLVCRDGDLDILQPVDPDRMNAVFAELAGKCVAKDVVIPLSCIDVETNRLIIGPADMLWCQGKCTEIRDSHRVGVHVIDPVICTVDPDGVADKKDLLKRLEQGEEIVQLVKGGQRITMAKLLQWEFIQASVHVKCGTLENVLGLRAMWHSAMRTEKRKRDSPFVLRIIRPLVKLTAKEKGRQLGVADIDSFPANDQAYTEERVVELVDGQQKAIRPFDRGERAVVRTKLAALFPRELRSLVKPERELLRKRTGTPLNCRRD